MLEALMDLATGREAAARPRAVPRIGEAMRSARTCYDHLAGRLGVAIADGLVARAALEGMGVRAGASRRRLCRSCLDWSERRAHVGGALWAAICARCLELGWVRRQPGTRAVLVLTTQRCGRPETVQEHSESLESTCLHIAGSWRADPHRRDHQVGCTYIRGGRRRKLKGCDAGSIRVTD